MNRPLNRYYDPYFEYQAVKLLPGQYYATQHDEMLVTVLGSCVSACLRDPVAACGGMNHFLLPAPGIRGLGKFESAARYGVHAMELLINALLKRGAKRERLEAKVFGGAAVVEGFTNIMVGEQNARFVKEFLQTERVALFATDLEGTHPRKLYYFPSTGEAFVKYLPVLTNDTIVRRESELLAVLSRSRTPDSTLFEEQTAVPDVRP